MTLGEVLDAACSAWGFAAGPHQTQYSGTSVYAQVGFVPPRHDVEPITREESYHWRGDFPAILEDGTEERLGVHAVTYRQLLVAAALGLIEGDVRGCR